MSVDAVVIGGGAVGVCCALELARRGAHVTLLERGPELAAGCSAGNAGLICPSHSTPIANPASLRNGLRWMWKRDSPFYLRPRPAVVPWLVRFALASRHPEEGTLAVRSLSVTSLELHAELAGLDTGFERRGVLNVYATGEQWEVGRREAERSGLPSRVLGPDETLELEPALSQPVAGAVLYPEEAHCDPSRFVHAVGRAAAEAGTEIRTGVEARRLVPGGVDTETGTIHAETVVVAAGAWSRDLLPLPVEGGKGYHVDFEAGEDDPRTPSWVQESWTIGTPLPGRLRVSGTLELAGLDLTLNPVRVDAVRRGGLRSFRGLEERRVVDTWAGLRPCLPDGLPAIGRTRRMKGVVVATGHAVKGLSLAPVTARLVAEIVAGEHPSHDLGPFDPDRF